MKINLIENYYYFMMIYLPVFIEKYCSNLVNLTSIIIKFITTQLGSNFYKNYY